MYKYELEIIEDKIVCTFANYYGVFVGTTSVKHLRDIQNYESDYDIFKLKDNLEDCFISKKLLVNWVSEQGESILITMNFKVENSKYEHQIGIVVNKL